ncbi:MarR family winged helix-turn-helix transcriptional regulator [Terrihabitans sp. B22-R8]|uniref:MarR family winged helix-turn-helix transcriptional regulator n=1 Tax=Terrihabitans sp. B22-R8 TaxID=3425128 RepID=UPI00403D1C03
MTDVISPPKIAEPSASPRPDETTLELIELLFFAYRDFVGDPDVLLEQYGFGRAHHRVLHFVSRNTDLKVADLLTILKITKQSLGRVLRDLVDKGFIEAREGREDRRQRLLRLTPKGEALTRELTVLQARRISGALGTMPGAADIVAGFLTAMINADERQDVMQLVTHPAGRS